MEKPLLARRGAGARHARELSRQAYRPERCRQRPTATSPSPETPLASIPSIGDRHGVLSAAASDGGDGRSRWSARLGGRRDVGRRGDGYGLRYGL